LYDPNRTDINLGLQKQIGFPGQMVIGGLSGLAFGGPVPWILNRTADTILVTPEARATARNGAPVIAENGLGGKVLPETWRNGINSCLLYTSPYNLGWNPVSMTIKKGSIVHRI